MTAPSKELAVRPAPTVRPPRTRTADRLLRAAMLVLVVAVCGGIMAWLGHRTGAAIAVAVAGLGVSAGLLSAAAVYAARTMRLNPWPGVALAAVLAGAAAWRLLPLAGLGWLRLPAVAVAAFGLWKAGRAGVRYYRRRADYHRWAQALAVPMAQGITQLEQVLAGLARTAHPERVIAPHFGAAPNAAWSLRVTNWAGTRIQQAVLQCPAHDDISTPDFLTRIRDALTRRAGVEWLSLSVATTRDEITIGVLDAPEDDEEDPSRRARAEAAAKDAAEDHLKGVKITILEWEEDSAGDEPADAGIAWPLRAFEITFDRNPNLTLPQNQDRFRYHMGAQLYNDPAQLRAAFNLPQCRVVLRKRATFPALVPLHPVDVRALFGRLVVIVYGSDEDGRLAYVQLSDTDAPHLLVTGGTGTGKSVLLRILAIAAARQGMDVRACDPKRVEMRGLRGWPGVSRIATRVPDMIRVIEETYEEMLERYAAIEEGRAKEEDFQRILLIIDEFLMFAMLINDYWQEQKALLGGKQPAEHPVMGKVRGIIVMGRGGMINKVVATQRGDAEIFPAGVRDSLGNRIALGHQTKESAQMMFGDASVGRDIPVIGSRGVGTALAEDGTVRVKVAWLPDPARWPDQFKPEDGDVEFQRDLLRAMLPPGTEWDGPLPYQPSDGGYDDTAAGDDVTAGKPHVRLLFFCRAGMLYREAHLTDGETGGSPATGDAAARYGWNPGPDGRLRPSGKWIGCAAAENGERRVFLYPAAVLELAAQMAKDMGVPFPFKRSDVDTALRNSGLLHSDDEDGDRRWTVLRPVPGNDLSKKDRRQRVWDVPEDEVIGDLAADEPEPAPPGPGPATPATATPPQPAAPPQRDKRADRLTGGDRIILAYEDGEVVDAIFCSLEPVPDQASPPEDGVARYDLSYRRVDNGEPGTVQVRPDHPIRLAPPVDGDDRRGEPQP